MGFGDGSSISWTTCKQSAPHSRQITTPTSHYSIFTGRMLFLMPNQHCQSTEGMLCSSGPYQMVQVSAVIDGPARRAASCTLCDAQCVKLAKVVGRTSSDRHKYSQLDRQKQKVYHTERPTRISQPKNNTRLTALCPGITRVSRYKKGKTNLDFTEDTVSGSGISWAICKSAPCFRQITTPAPHHSVFYMPDALPATQ